ncbi:hypothetical protein BC941DRAFT_432356 [Chlamydoabsidia padenii]|nr:hypothetical protein BC941DRAFT_432356 [Chlamydoabsidia padenii]
MESDHWTQLKKEIHDKCVAHKYTEESDKSLSVAITAILQREKSPEKVSTILTSLINSTYDQQLTTWMITRLTELECHTAAESPTLRSQQNSTTEIQQVYPHVLTRLGKRTRCPDWPLCDNRQTCRFFHPTTVCRKFPDCPKKTKHCLFIHPYLPPKKQYQTDLTERAFPCRYFPFCGKDDCPYFHPPCSQKAYLTLCYYGEACTRPGCPYHHIKDNCKFDGACTRFGCLHKHPIQLGNSRHYSLVINNNSNVQNTETVG